MVDASPAHRDEYHQYDGDRYPVARRFARLLHADCSPTLRTRRRTTMRRTAPGPGEPARRRTPLSFGQRLGLSYAAQGFRERRVEGVRSR